MEKFESIREEQIRKIKAKYGLNGKLVLFMGLVDYKPTKEGIFFLLYRVIPLIHHIFPDVNLALIGGTIGYRPTCCLVSS